VSYGRLKVVGIVEKTMPEGGMARLVHLRPIDCKMPDMKYSDFLNVDIASFPYKGDEDGIALNLSGDKYDGRDRIAAMFMLQRRYVEDGKEVHFVVDDEMLNSINFARLSAPLNIYTSMEDLKNNHPYQLQSSLPILESV
jgi:hypothetical protein